MKKNDLKKLTQLTYSFHNVFRDFIQGYDKIEPSPASKEKIKKLLFPLCYDPKFPSLEFGSLLPPNSTNPKLNQLRQKMSYTYPLFLEFLSDIKTQEKNIQELIQNKTFTFLIGNNYGIEKFADLFKKASKQSIRIEPALFISADPEYSLKNKNISIEKDIQKTKELALALKQETKSSTHLYISGYNGVFEKRDTPLETLHNTTLNIIDNIPAKIYRLGDTSGLSTPKTHIEILEKILKKIPPTQIACHFHYNPKEPEMKTKQRVTTLILESMLHDITTFDGNSYKGGQQNPLSKLPNAALSGNLLFEHFQEILNTINTTK